MKKEQIYDLALKQNGFVNQAVVCMEEMGELIKELSKDIRGKGNRKCIAEEIADVQIMVEQMVRYYECLDLIKEYKHKKLQRLEKRLMMGNEDGR